MTYQAWSFDDSLPGFDLEEVRRSVESGDPVTLLFGDGYEAEVYRTEGQYFGALSRDGDPIEDSAAASWDGLREGIREAIKKHRLESASE